MSLMETPADVAGGLETRILSVRGHRVMLDGDLAELYGVPTKALNQAVKRNARRFPLDFAFRLTPEESLSMRSQSVTASKRNVRHLPFAFTEHGALMAANVLNSPRAVEASVFVVRAFVRLRQVLAPHRQLAAKLTEMERRLDTHDETIREIMTAIKVLMEPPEDDPPRERIGFHQD
ncbi:MAG TPA: ORF6N domain-containing protein [Planctomycetota bacterium]|nr:ORF6N domain-containing protein [Planctomycetota bacterium]